MHIKCSGAVAPSVTLALAVIGIGLSAGRANAQITDRGAEWEKPFFQQQAWNEEKWEESQLYAKKLSTSNSAPEVNKKMKHSYAWQMEWSKPFFQQNPWDQEMVEEQWSERNATLAYQRMSPPDIGHPVPIRLTCPRTAAAMDPVKCDVRCGEVDYNASGPNHVTIAIKFEHGAGSYSLDNKTWTDVSPGPGNPVVISVPLESGHHHGSFYVRSLDDTNDNIEMSPDNSYCAVDPAGSFTVAEITTSIPNTISTF